jgi:hypothetical protein
MLWMPFTPLIFNTAVSIIDSKGIDPNSRLARNELQCLDYLLCSRLCSFLLLYLYCVHSQNSYWL